MKNIFKKNQIIITALAIMIAIAGYLSFTNNDKPEVADTVETTNPDLEGYEDISQVDGTEVAQGTTDTTTTDTTTGDKTTSDDILTGTDETLDGTRDTGTDAETTAATENNEDAAADTEDGELGDLSDNDILEAANDVKDTGELDLEDGVPGEAVLASNTLEAGYFITNKMEREQMRSKNKDAYLEIIESKDVTEELKQDTIARYLELTKNAELENATEILLGARGFDDALVSINDGKVDVIINAESIDDQQLAIIEDIVKRKTEIAVKNINIVPAVTVE